MVPITIVASQSRSFQCEDSADFAFAEHGVNDAVDRDLPLRLDLRRHSLTGFEWGYGRSGPAQLALALLADPLGNDELAQNYYQQFKRKVINQLPDSWMLTASEIRQFVAGLQQESFIESAIHD